MNESLFGFSGITALGTYDFGHCHTSIIGHRDMLTVSASAAHGDPFLDFFHSVHSYARRRNSSGPPPPFYSLDLLPIF